jgi:hypothetical protein
VSAGCGERDILQAVSAIVVKTLSNYTNHPFHTPVDPVFAHRAWVGQARSAGRVDHPCRGGRLAGITDSEPSVRPSPTATAD